MKYFKRVGVTLVAAMTALSIAGCSGGTSAPEKKEMTVEEKVEAAQTAMADVKSMDAVMTMEMGLAMDNGTQAQNLNMNTSMDVTSFTDPLKMKIDMNMDMGEMGSQAMTIYAEETEDGKYMMYMTDGSQWASQEVPVETFAQYDAKDSMNMYLDGVTELKDSGTEKVNEKDAFKIDGIIAGDALEETIKASGALDNLTQTLGGQIDADALESMFKDLGNISVSVWLDAETNYPVKYSMDMTDVMDKLYTNLFSTVPGAENMSIHVEKMTIGMECSNYGNATDFEIPAEAKQ